MSYSSSALSEQLRASLSLPFKRRSLVWWLLWPALFCLSAIYAAILALRRTYFFWLHRHRPMRTGFDRVGAIMSIGNLSLGGTGKSPLVRILAKDALSRGQVVLVLSRGYLAPGGRRGFFVSYASGSNQWIDACSPQLTAGCLGDELRELHELLSRDTFPSGAALLIGQDPQRVKLLRIFQSALSRSTRASSDVCVLLDDGFQHLPCPRDLDILVSSAHEFDSPPYCVPLGPFREGWGRSLYRLRNSAPVHLINRSGFSFAAPSELGEDIDQLSLQKSSYGFLDYILHFQDSSGATARSKSLRSAKRLFTVTGIAAPERFLSSVGARLYAEYGQTVDWHGIHLPDHSVFLNERVRPLLKLAQTDSDPVLVLTMKDWCRWKADPDFASFIKSFTVIIAIVEPVLTRIGKREVGTDTPLQELWSRALENGKRRLSGASGQ